MLAISLGSQPASVSKLWVILIEYTFMLLPKRHNWATKQQHPASLVAQRLKRLPTMLETWVQSLGRKEPLEKEMATHSSIRVWRIPWTEEPDGLQSTGSQRVGHDWATSLHTSVQLRPYQPHPTHSFLVPRTYSPVDILFFNMLIHSIIIPCMVTLNT